MVDRLRLPATIGAVASLVVAILVLLPYFLPEAGPEAISTYYDFGIVGGLTILLIALVTVVVFAAGWRGRSDPATAAGTALGLGLVATLLAASWALAVPYGVVVQLTTETWFEHHRWAVVGGSLAMAVCGVWYASVLRLF